MIPLCFQPYYCYGETLGVEVWFEPVEVGVLLTFDYFSWTIFVFSELRNRIMCIVHF